MSAAASDARLDLLEAAFTEGEGELLGISVRPITLGTLNLCRRLELTLVLRPELEGELPEEDKQRQALMFVWLHSAPLREVLAAVRDGTWEHAFAAFAQGGSQLVVPVVLHEIRRVSKLVEAALVEVLPKPGRSGDEDAPANLLEPGFTASLAFTLARETGWSEHFVLWRLPLARALQYYHCALRSVLAWTVKPGPPLASQVARLEQWAAALTSEGDDGEDD